MARCALPPHQASCQCRLYAARTLQQAEIAAETKGSRSVICEGRPAAAAGVFSLELGSTTFGRGVRMFQLHLRLVSVALLSFSIVPIAFGQIVATGDSITGNWSCHSIWKRTKPTMALRRSRERSSGSRRCTILG